MSLTTVIKNNNDFSINFKNIVNKVIPKEKDLKTLSGKRPFSEEYEIRAKYNLRNFDNAGLVGIAFDYLARFMIANKLSDETLKDAAISELASDIGLRIAKRRLDTLEFEPIERVYKRAIIDIRKYIYSKDSTLPIIIIRYSQLLAQLERGYRCGYLDVTSSIDEITRELIVLCKVFDAKFIKPNLVKENSKVVFNPRFKECSDAVGGADADIYIDGTLYEFKTSKNKNYKYEDVAQLTSYYLFGEILLDKGYDSSFEYILENDKCKIDRIAIYSARYGEIAYFDFDNININLKDDFIRYLRSLMKV